MSFRYVGLEEAIAHPGTRMIVVGEIPSGWGEAAKAIFHVKGLDVVAMRLDQRDERQRAFAGFDNAPVVVHGAEKPRAGWAEILHLAERLAPEPSLLPFDASDRALVMGLSHEICGEGGLGWTRRLEMIHGGLKGGVGFHPKVAAYLAPRYGYSPEVAEAAPARVAAILSMLASRLKAQAVKGSSYLVGSALTAADLYSAAFMAMFRPLPPDLCPMRESARLVFETMSPTIAAALDPVLLAHRDRIYAERLETPLQL